MNSARKKAYLALISCALIWGASQPLVKSALEFVTPSQFLFLRYLIAVPLVIPLIVRSFKRNHYSFKKILMIILIESISIGTLFILYAGLTYVNALHSSLIIQTRPIFVTLAGLFLLNETIERHELFGLILSILGTFIILAKPFFLHYEGFTSDIFIGTSIIILSNLINAVNVILIKKHYKDISKPAISSIHMLVGLALFSLYLIPSGKLPDLNIFLIHPQVILPVFYMAILGSVVGLTLSNFALSKIEASEATLFSYLQPLVYIPLSIFWLNEAFEPIQFIGMTIVFLGIVSAASRPKKKFLKHGIPLLNRLRLTQTNLSPHYPSGI